MGRDGKYLGREEVGAVIGVADVDKTFALYQDDARLGVGNRAVMRAPIAGAKARGAAILGIFQAADMQARVCRRAVDVGAFVPAHRAAP